MIVRTVVGSTLNVQPVLTPTSGATDVTLEVVRRWLEAPTAASHAESVGRTPACDSQALLLSAITDRSAGVEYKSNARDMTGTLAAVHAELLAAAGQATPSASQIRQVLSEPRLVVLNAPPAMADVVAGRIDIHAYAMWVLREAYLGQSEVLYDYAAKVESSNERKKTIRQQLEGVRETLGANAGKDEGATLDPPYVDESAGVSNGITRLVPVGTSLPPAALMEQYATLVPIADATKPAAAPALKAELERIDAKIEATEKKLKKATRRGDLSAMGTQATELARLREQRARAAAPVPPGMSKDEQTTALAQLDADIKRLTREITQAGGNGRWLAFGELHEDLRAVMRQRDDLLAGKMPRGYEPSRIEKMQREYGGSQDDAEQLRADIESFKNDVVDRLGQLSDEEKTALLAQLNEQGLSILFTGVEADSGSGHDLERVQKTDVRPNRGESLDAFVTRVVETYGAELVVRLQRAGGDVLSATLRMYVPGFEVGTLQSAGSAAAGTPESAQAPSATAQSITKVGQLQAEEKRLEEELNTVGDDAQLANLDLQNALQQLQQILQTLSNLSKSEADGNLAVIRNLAG